MAKFIDKKVKEIADSIAPLLQEINLQTEIAIPEMNRKVDLIIKNKIQDQKEIEHTLDRLLDFAFNSEMLNIFKKLCRYYYKIDPEATADYVLIYKRMYEDEKENGNL